MFARKEFYEDLVLWSILSFGKAQRTGTKPTIWQRFLDDVCYLCDAKSGGKSVVSIAVSELSRCQYFFISANGGLRKAAQQLHLVLVELHGIKQMSDIDLEITKERLLEIGVRDSAMKVRNYVRELRLHIRSVEHLESIREGEQVPNQRQEATCRQSILSSQALMRRSKMLVALKLCAMLNLIITEFGFIAKTV